MREPISEALLPAGFELCRAPGAYLAWRTELAPELGRSGFGLEADGALRASELAGRRPLHLLCTEAGTFVVRRFSHGGLARRLTGERFADPTRPFRELALSESLRARGIATPTVVAARARRAPLFGWLLALVTRRVEGASDLGQLLGEARRGELDRRTLRALLAQAGRFVRRLHEAGLWHADLNPNNLLAIRASLESGRAELLVLDLDRSELRAELGPRERAHNLRRLYRHVERREELHGRALARTDHARFLCAYEPEREARRALWRAIARAHARHSLLHRLGWLLEGSSRRADARHRARNA